VKRIEADKIGASWGTTLNIEKCPINATNLQIFLKTFTYRQQYELKNIYFENCLL